MDRLIFEYDAKNWTVCSNKTKRIGPFFKYDSKKWFFFFHNMSHTELNFLNITERIELLFLIWLKELNSFFWYDSKNLTPFLIRLEELNSFVEYDSTKWTLFYWLKELKFFNVIQRVFFAKMTLSILPFKKKRTQELIFFWKTMTHRMEQFFSILLKELNPFQHMTRRIEHFCNRTFSIWLKGWNFSNMIWRVEPTFFLIYRFDFLGEMSQIFEPFLNMTQRIELFSSDSHNWALF